MNLKDASDELGKTLHHAADDGERKARGLIHSASDEIFHVRDYLSTEIRSNPVRSSLIALGVGLFLGRLLHR